MAGEIINRGKVIIDLVAGKVDIPVPNFAPFNRGQQDATDATKEHTQATQAQQRATEQLNAQYKAQVAALNEIGRASMRDAQGGNKWNAGLDRMRASEEAARAAQQRATEQANQRALQQQRAMGESLDRMAIGFMKVSRAAVLLGFSQDESLQDLLRNLALAQAAFDLFDGSRKIVRGLTDAMRQAAEQGKTLAQVIGTTNITLGVTAAAVLALAIAWRESEAAADKYHQAALKGLEIQQDLDRRIQDLGPRDRIAKDLLLETQKSVQPGSSTNEQAQAKLDANLKLSDVLKQELQAQKEGLANQRQSLELAKQQLASVNQRIDAEKKANDSIAASFSRLKDFEQKQAIEAAGKLKRGENISEYQRDLIEKAGAGGVAEADRTREGNREGAQTFVNELRGLEGASVGSTNSINEMNKQATEFAKKLKQITGGLSESDFLANLDQRNKVIEQAFKDVDKLLIDNLNKLRVELSKALSQNQDIANANQSVGDSWLGNLF